MPDQTEKVLLELRLNAEQLKSELGQVRQRTKELRDNTKLVNGDLEKLAAVGAQNTKEYAGLLAQLGDNERQLVSLGRRAQELNKNLDAVESSAGSFNKLGAETAFLEKQLKEAAVGVNITAEGYDLLAKKVNDGYQAQRDFARNVSNNNRELVGSYAESLAPALDDVKKKTDVVAGSLGAMREQLDALFKKRENAVGPELKEINDEILNVKSSIGAAEGRFDEFGEKIQRNRQKENIDTLGDAFGGVAASVNVATLLLGENTKASAAATAATKALAVAQSIRQIQIGIGSAKDAAAIVITGAKNLFIKAEAKAQTEAATAAGVHAAATAADTAATQASAAAAGEATVAAGANAEATTAEAEAAGTDAAAQTARAAATLAATAAAEAGAGASTAAAAASTTQAAATEAATVATDELTTAFSLNPIGAIIVAVLALIGALFAYSKASDGTKRKVDDLVKTLFYLSSPFGAIVGLVELLYRKFEIVREALDPLLAGLEKLGSFVKTEAVDFGRYIGVLDTVAEAAVKNADKIAKATADRAGLYEAEAKLLELNGAKLSEYREKEREGLIASYNAERDKLDSLRALRAERAADNDKLTEAETKSLVEQAVKVRQLSAQIGQYDRETTDQHIGLLQKELTARASSIEAQLELVRSGSAEELQLQKQRLELQYLAATSAARLTAAERKAIDDKYNADSAALDRNYLQARRAARLTNEASGIAGRLELVRLGGARELALLVEQLRNQRDQQLNNYNLSAADRAAINAKFRTDELRLTVDFARSVAVVDIQNQQSAVNAKLALVVQGSQAEYDLRLAAINTQTQLDLAQLDKRRDNTEKEKEIRANGLAQINQLDAQFLDAALARNAEQLANQKSIIDSAVNLMSAGLDEGQKQQLIASAGYENARREQILASARTELAAINGEAAKRLFAAGTDAAARQAIEQDAADKRLALEKNTAAALLNLDQETNEQRKKNVLGRVGAVLDITKTALDDLSTITDAQAQAETDAREARMNRELQSVGDNAAQQKVIKDKYAKQAARDEAEAAEKRRRLQIAQALVNAGLAITQILAAPTAPFVEPFATIVRGVQIGLVVATTAAQIASMKSQKFARGGVVAGPSHAAGGVQLFHRSGAHVGEMEGDETILVPGVARSPVLRPLASLLNVLAGGRNFAGPPTATTFPQLARFAAGGVVTFDPSLTSGRSGGAAAPVAALGLDYAELARHLAPVLTGAVAALPAPVLVLSELDEAQQKTTYTQQQADNK